MRVLIISDSHGRTENIEVLSKTEGNFDLVIHCGDGIGDFDHISELFNCRVTGVPGNCDLFSREPAMLNLNIEGKIIHIEHGHRLPVFSESALLDFAERNGYDVVLYGHTHHQLVINRGKYRVVNPGSISRPRDGYPSYIIMTTDGKGGLSFETKRL